MFRLVEVINFKILKFLDKHREFINFFSDNYSYNCSDIFADENH